MTTIPNQRLSTRGRPVEATAPAAKRKLDPLRLALFVLTLLTVSRIHQHFSFLAPLRPALLLAGFAMGYAFLNPKLLSGSRWLQTWPARVVVGLAVIACASAVFGISLGSSGRFILEDYSKVFIFCFLLMATVRDARELRLYIWAYVLSAGVLVWMSLFVFGLSKAGPDGISRLSSLYTYDANDVGVVLLAGLGLTILTFQVSGMRGKLLSGIIMLGIGVTIARTGSRGAFIGLLALGFVLLVLVRGVSIAKRLLFVGVALAGVAMASPEGYWEQMTTVFRPTSDYNWSSETGRKAVWLRGLAYMKTYPLFGVGVNNFPRAEGTISDRAKNYIPGEAGIRWMAPHNSYVQAAAEMGIPGVVLWTSLVVGGFVAMIRMRRRLPPAWEKGDEDERFLYQATVYLPVAIAGFGTSASFVSFAYLDPVYILAAYVTGMYVVLGQRLPGGVTAVPRSRAAARNARIGRPWSYLLAQRDVPFDPS